MAIYGIDGIMNNECLTPQMSTTQRLTGRGTRRSRSVWRSQRVRVRRPWSSGWCSTTDTCTASCAATTRWSRLSTLTSPKLMSSLRVRPALSYVFHNIPSYLAGFLRVNYFFAQCLMHYEHYSVFQLS